MAEIILNGQSVKTEAADMEDLKRQTYASEGLSEDIQRHCVWIVEGFQTDENLSLKDGMIINWIQKGKMPDREEMESMLCARHTDSLPFRDLFAGVKRLLSDDGIFSAIVPVEVVEQFVAESCILGFYLIRKCGVKTVERKQPKRFMLSFAKHRISPYEEHVETMMESQGNRSEWYRKITDEFYLSE